MSIWIVGFGPALVIPIRRNTKLSSDEGISTSNYYIVPIKKIVRLLIICQSQRRSQDFSLEGMKEIVT